MSASAPKNAPNPEKETKKRKLTKARSKISNPSNPSRKKQKAVIPAAKLGPPVSPPKKFNFTGVPSLGPETIERVVSRNKMAGENPATSQALKRLSGLSGLQNQEERKRLMDELGLKNPQAEIEKTEQARLKAKHFAEIKRSAALVFDTKSGLSKKAKASHVQAVTAEQKERDKLQKPAREKGETEKERQERERLERERQDRESARLSAQMAKLKAKKDAAFKFRGPVYTTRVLAQAKEKTEGRKRKGSKKGKKGRPGAQKKSRKKKN